MNNLHEGNLISNRYLLTRLLDHGGMGSVWLARDTKLNSDVALKFLSEKLAGDISAVNNFRTEWEIASKLVHPNIVKVFEYFTNENSPPFFSMEYIEGKDISALSEGNFLETLKPILLVIDALDYAHNQGVYHGDLKTNNVLLNKRGKPILIDFGISHYQLNKKNEDCSPALSDIFSLGVLIHEILVGVPPKNNKIIDDSVEKKSSRKIESLIKEMIDPNDVNKPSLKKTASSLVEEGITPGNAELSSLSDSEAEEKLVAQNFKKIPDRFVSQDNTISGSNEGVSPKVFWMSLSLILTFCFFVFFILPDKIGKEFEFPQEQFSDTDQSLIDENIDNSENTVEQQKMAEEMLDKILIEMNNLRNQGVSKWGGIDFRNAEENYKLGDQEYLNSNYISALNYYREAFTNIDKLSKTVDEQLSINLKSAEKAFKENNFNDAIYFFDIVVSIKPDNPEYQSFYDRALVLEDVLDLYTTAIKKNNQKEFEDARELILRSLVLDPEYGPSINLLSEIERNILRRNFESRMTEGFVALSSLDFVSARVLFSEAKKLYPESQEVIDAISQLDQAEKDQFITNMEKELIILEDEEQWENAVESYKEILIADPDLQFAREGLKRALFRSDISSKLDNYIENYNSLNDTDILQQATNLLIKVSTFERKPRIEQQISELRRLLKRASTPIDVQLVSDNLTNVSILKIGSFSFFSKEIIKLRPGNYTAIGIRNGYRDVRIDFTVAPENDAKPIKIVCEEVI